MLRETVAKVYAKALFSVALKLNRVDEQKRDLVKVCRIFKEHPALRRALEAPTIPSSVKKRMIKELLENRVEQTTLHFYYLLVDKNREVYADAVLEAYGQLVREHKGIVRCLVKTASPLPPSVRHDLERSLMKYTGSKVELIIQVEPELLGGFVVRVGDRLIDASLKTQLEKVRGRLLSS